MILTPNWTVDRRVRLKCQSERFHTGEYQQLSVQHRSEGSSVSAPLYRVETLE